MTEQTCEVAPSSPMSRAEFPPFPRFAGKVVTRPAGFRAEVGANARLTDYTVAAYQYAMSTRPDMCQPAAIIYAANESDVKLAIKYAYDANLSLAVRSGGHQYGGFSSGRGETIQLDVRALRLISELHPEDKTITVGTGCIVRELDEKLAPMGAFVVHGECAHVAVGGHVQSGGFPPLFTRSFGFFCDYITKFTIVLSPRNDDEEPPTVVVMKPIPGETSAENDELWFAVLGGSPGNFGVILDVTIKPLWDRDYPHSRGLALFRTFQGEKGKRDLNEWLQMVAEFADDDDLPADYNFNAITLAGNPLECLDQNNNIDIKMAAQHPEIYGERAPGCPFVIGLFINWCNLRGDACKFEDFDGKYCAKEIFATIEARTRKMDTRWQRSVGRIKMAVGRLLFRKAVAMNGCARWKGNPSPMSQLLADSVFGARIQANPCVSAVYASTSTNLSRSGFAEWSAQIVRDVSKKQGLWPDIQWGGIGGKHSRMRTEHSKNPCAIPHRGTNFFVFHYIHYDNVIRGQDNDEPRQHALKNCKDVSAELTGEGGFMGCDRRWLAFPCQDEDLDSLHSHYYDSEYVYLRVLKAKRVWDPKDIFTPNLFCVGASRKYHTAPPASAALMSIEALESEIAKHARGCDTECGSS